jgi:hypothetical protein
MKKLLLLPLLTTVALAMAYPAAAGKPEKSVFSFDDPVFEAFAGPRTGDFSSARIYRYRPLPSGSFPRVLARFGDGGAALAERPVGEGRVLVWTSTLDSDWNDLTLQPIFLPFLHLCV